MSLKTGTLIVSRGNYEISKKSEIEEYYKVLMPLYEKYGYKPAIKGMKSADVHGFTIQMYVGMGFFPDIEKALKCHEDSEYKKALALRDKFMSDYQLSLFSTPDVEIFGEIEQAYNTVNSEYEEDMSFIIYRNNIKKAHLNEIAEYADKMSKVMGKYHAEPFYYGKKVKDIEGKSVGDYLGITFFPSAMKAKECFLDDEYYELSELRDKFTTDFNTTIYGPVMQ